MGLVAIGKNVALCDATVTLFIYWYMASLRLCLLLLVYTCQCYFLPCTVHVLTTTGLYCIIFYYSTNQTCAVMAGFVRGEPYFCARMFLPLPHSVEYYCRKLLPKLPQWRHERNSAFGDKTVLCDKVLNHIIPYLVEVLVQDGIYFTKQFPKHPMSILLMVRTVCYNSSTETTD